MATTEAVVLHGPRDLRIETREVGAPGPGEVAVRVGAGGICGSDLHYFLDGGFGTIRVREPIILGHEVAGTVEALGRGVTGLREGDRVAVNPSHPCGTVLTAPAARSSTASTCASGAARCGCPTSKAASAGAWLGRRGNACRWATG